MTTQLSITLLNFNPHSNKHRGRDRQSAQDTEIWIKCVQIARHNSRDLNLKKKWLNVSTPSAWNELKQLIEVPVLFAVKCTILKSLLSERLLFQSKRPKLFVYYFIVAMTRNFSITPCASFACTSFLLTDFFFVFVIRHGNWLYLNWKLADGVRAKCPKGSFGYFVGSCWKLSVWKGIDWCGSFTKGCLMDQEIEEFLE